jgi:hypothetical protein
MLVLFIISLAILLIVGIGFYFWQRKSVSGSDQLLPPAPDFRGLFGEDSSSREVKRKRAKAEREQLYLSLLEAAKNGERSALDEAHKTADGAVYDRVLSEMTAQAESDAQLLALASYVAQKDLPVNAALARAVVASWKNSPDRAGTAKALHFAALSNDAGLYGETVEEALHLWRAGKLNEIPPVELQALFDGEFWLLSSRSRSSGAGFVLKSTLDNARRELQAVAGAKQ